MRGGRRWTRWLISRPPCPHVRGPWMPGAAARRGTVPVARAGGMGIQVAIRRRGTRESDPPARGGRGISHLAAQQHGAAQSDLAATHVDGGPGDEHRDPGDALEPARSALRDAHGERHGARLGEACRGAAEHVGLRPRLREAELRASPGCRLAVTLHVAARSALQRRPSPFLTTSFSGWMAEPASAAARLPPARAPALPPPPPPPEPPWPPDVPVEPPPVDPAPAPP